MKLIVNGIGAFALLWFGRNGGGDEKYEMMKREDTPRHPNVLKSILKAHEGQFWNQTKSAEAESLRKKIHQMNHPTKVTTILAISTVFKNSSRYLSFFMF